MNSEGGKPGNVLTVNGNYTGNNGLMTFNATLGGDNSPTDKMNVKGDTQGNTRVRVDNIGGVGAQTVNGIELIENRARQRWCRDVNTRRRNRNASDNGMGKAY
ncbi:autotransporter outer membrane beta-barrel domain-containing protein [Escherichia coli O8]|nr:autotransporter outer membrane beta-barrel domain-containing protein [Escherichia coli O8]